MPENFEIAFPWVFWLSPLPLIFYALLPPLKLRSSSLRYSNFSRIEPYTGQKPRKAALVRRRGLGQWLLLSTVWLLTLAALSNPRSVEDPELKVKTSRNFLILADLSVSMAERDWEIAGRRARRWDAVKEVMHDFIQRREGDRMGLIFFASGAYVQAPFTPDLETVDRLLDEADVGMAGQATHLGKAIVKGVEMFQQDTLKTKVMLLLTDGVDTGTDILPMDAAALAEKDSIQIYTIGIGNPTDSNSDLDERTLREISERTGASYFRASDAERLDEIYAELDALQPIEYEEETYRPEVLYYHYPLGAAIGLMVIYMLFATIWSAFKWIIAAFRDG